MNQIKKRLEIIKIAISMTDSETIRLQLLKLEPFEVDPKLDEIIDLLKIKNYAQAQYLITEYIDPTKITEEPPIEQKEEDQETKRTKNDISKKHSIIEEFQIIMPGSKEDEEVQEEKSQNSSLHKTIPPHRILLEAQENEEELIEDDSHETSCEDESQTHQNEELQQKQEIEEEYIEEYYTKYNEGEEPYEEYSGNDENNNEPESEDAETTDESFDNASDNEIQEKSKPAPIYDIEERFEQIYGVYDFLHETDTRYQSTKIWITQIKNRGVNDSSLQAMLQHIENLKKRDDTSEAAQLICVCAATNLQLGRLLLARELYRGKLVTQDEVEAYKIIHELAQEDYNEAVCDLGQFYEFGIAISKNEKKAKELYEKAFSSGLQRAKAHLERISKKNGIFSKILQ